MAKKKLKETPFKASDKEYFMPDTNKQGWGQIQGQTTEVVKSEDNGVRTTIRTGINA